MHRKLMTVALASPSPPFTSESFSNTARQMAWRCLGFAGVMCAIVGCATPPAPRDAADVRLADEVESPAPIAIPDTRPRLVSASVSDVAGSDDRPQRAPLPWLSPSRIGAAVRAHHGDFQACQALGDVLSQRADGAVTVGWAVRANGSVNQVTLDTSTFDNDSINTCVLGVARQVTFPPSAAPTEVSWTVEFRGAARGTLADATLR